jgi:hypothetical protein
MIVYDEWFTFFWACRRNLVDFFVYRIVIDNIVILPITKIGGNPLEQC